MDIFAYALQMELDGETYYTKLAKNAGYKDLEVVFLDLAKAEKSHYDIIKAARDEGHYTFTPEPVRNLPNVFAFPDELKEKSPEWLAQWKKEQVDVYQAALIKEQQSVELYKDLKVKVAVAEEKDICDRLILEETKHVHVIEDLIEMLNHVNDWVEAAEFNPKDDAY
ncbi:MAG: ferritin family protein [Selenomonadaceae bacterium]